jgi:signal transduction histidine kinase
LAFSTELSPFSVPDQSSGGSPQFRVPEQRLLSRLLRRYPIGKLWTFNGYADESSEEEQDEVPLVSSSASSLGAKSLQSRGKEVKFLMACFPDATQVLYAPIYEAASASHIGACFVVSVKPEAVFTTQTESAWMRAFMNSISVAYGLASSKASNKQKGAFISSISHELRSPLHGITAAVGMLCCAWLRKVMPT